MVDSALMNTLKSLTCVVLFGFGSLAFEAYEFYEPHDIFIALDLFNKNSHLTAHLLQTYIQRDETWREARNYEGKSPLRVALENMDIPSVLTLLRAEAEAQAGDIKLFYDNIVSQMAAMPLEVSADGSVDYERVFDKNNEVQEFDANPPVKEIASDLAQKLAHFLYTALKQRSIAQVCGLEDPDAIVNSACQFPLFVASKEVVAQAILKVAMMDGINKDDLEFLADHYETLLFDGRPMTALKLQPIMQILVRLGHEKQLMRLITKYDPIFHNPTLETEKKQEVRVLSPRRKQSVNILEKLASYPQYPLAQAILERDRSFASQMYVEEWIKITADNNSDLQKWLKNLSDFVQASILWGVGKELWNNYHYWLAVYEDLKAKNDLMGASSVALGLNNPTVTRITKAEDIKLVAPDRDYEEYFKEEAAAQNQLLVPNFSTHATRASKVALGVWVTQHNGQPTIPHSISEYLVSLRQKIDKTRMLAAKGVEFRAPKSLQEVIDNLPSMPEDLPHALSQAYFINYENMANRYPNNDMRTWKFEDIVYFMINLIDDDGKKAVEPKYHTRVLRTLITNFGILDGPNLIDALSCECDQIFLLEPRSRDSFKEFPMLKILLEALREKATTDNVFKTEEECGITEVWYARFNEFQKAYNIAMFRSSSSVKETKTLLSLGDLTSISGGPDAEASLVKLRDGMSNRTARKKLCRSSRSLPEGLRNLDPVRLPALTENQVERPKKKSLKSPRRLSRTLEEDPKHGSRVESTRPKKRGSGRLIRMLSLSSITSKVKCLAHGEEQSEPKEPK